MNELVITREYAEAIFQMYGFVEHEGCRVDDDADLLNSIVSKYPGLGVEYAELMTYVNDDC